jgi:hypothetical protein
MKQEESSLQSSHRVSGELGEGSGEAQSWQAREKVCISLVSYRAADDASCDLSFTLSAARGLLAKAFGG